MLKRIGTFCLLLFIVGCSQTPEPDNNSVEETKQVDQAERDDDSEDGILDSFNRSMWKLNYTILDPNIVRPVSVTYAEYTPSPVRTGISNFLANLEEPSSMVNNLIMGKGEIAVVHFNRFWLNTTLGLVGIIDVASAADINKPGTTSFGDALGYYGVANGPFIMLPAYGPWTLREAGDIVDGLYMPLSYLNLWQNLGKWFFQGMETRVRLVSQEPLLESSPDPYALTREVYLQYRDFKADIAAPPTESDEELDDYLDEIDE